MNIKNSLMIAGAALLLSSSVALARDPVPQDTDTFELYGEVEGWKIYKVLELETCLAERVDENGNVVQMGLTKNHKHGYIGVFTQADIDIKNREKVEIDVDGFIYEDRARGIKSRELQGNYSGGYIIVKDENMVTAIAEGQTLTAFPRRTAAFAVDLTGTKAAIEEGRKCNLEMAT
ncbi:MAG: hypothetical protein AAGF79_03765 [Pseudomonadota bacterium]